MVNNRRRFPKKEGVVFRMSFGGGAGEASDVPEKEEQSVKFNGARESTKKTNGKQPQHDEDEQEEGIEEEVVDGEDDDIFGDDEGEEDDEDAGPSKGPSKPAHSKAAPSKRKPDDDLVPNELAFGIDDEYDYEQHIREPGKGLFVGADVEYTEKVLNQLNMGHKVKKLREMNGQQFIDFDDIKEKEVDEALFAVNEQYDELDDDFVLQANGGEAVDIKETEIKGLRKSVNKKKVDKDKFAMPSFGNGPLDDDDIDYEDFDEYYDGDDDVDARRYGGDATYDADRKPRLIDEQFDHMLDQYDDANIGEYMDPKDPEVMGKCEVDTEDPLFQEYIVARQRSKGPAYTPSSFDFPEEAPPSSADKENQKPKETAREESDAEYDDEILDQLYPPKTEEKWDCESFISTYSNLENHPKLIVEQSNRIKLSKKTGLPLGVLAGRGQKQEIKETKEKEKEKESDDEDEEDEAENAGKPRSKDETPEERRERKKAIKEAKKASREKKKLVKQAYKSEEIKQTNVLVSQRVHQRVVYKF